MAESDFLRRYFDGRRQREAAQTGASVLLSPYEPDQMAEGISIGAELGVAPGAVTAAPDIFRSRLAQKRATTALTAAPKTSAWLQDPVNGSLAKDDLENLSWFERNTGPLGRAVGRGVRRVPLIEDVGTAQINARIVSDIGRSYDEIYQEELARFGPNPPYVIQSDARRAAQLRFDLVQDLRPEDLQRYVQKGADALRDARLRMDAIADVPMSGVAASFRDKTLAASENTLVGVIGAFAKDPAGGAAFVVETAAEFLPVLAVSSVATAATRNPVAGVAVMGGSSFLIENSASAMEFLSEKGVDLSTPEAAMTVLQNAELMQEARDRGLTRGLIIGMMDALSGGVAGKTLAKSPVGDVIAQGIAQVAFGAGGEGFAQLAAGQEVSWADIVIEGLAELATAPIEVLGVGGRKFLKGSTQQAKAGKTAALLDETEAQAIASKLRERAPEKFKEALDTQGLGDQAVYVPADALREYFQAKDVQFDDEIMRAWGIDPVAFEEAAATGTDVGIPMSNYATYIAGSEDAAWFKENATTDPEEMSLVMAKEFNASVQEIMMEAFEEAERERLSDLEMRAADVQIYDQVFGQLRAAGRSPDVAKSEASIWAAFWRTMGERYGEDPLDLARAMGVDIRGPQSEFTRRRDQLDIALNTLRTKGALKPQGLSLAEFIKAKGGVQDEGGDVAAVEPPKGVVAESDQEIKARKSQPSLDGMPSEGRGVNLEDMARMAVEAGYFPDLMAAVADGQMDGIVDRLVQALRDDVSGRKVYAEGEGPDAALQALSEALSERGLDPSTMTNDEIAAAMEADPDGLTYNQDGTLKTETPEFKAWFGDSKVVGPDGEPLVVYHGTGKDFEAFDPSKAGSSIDSGFLGAGVYMTNLPRIADYYADVSARYGSGQNVMPLFVSLQNPYMWGLKTFGVRDLVNLGTPLPDEVHQAVIDRTGFKFDPNEEPDYSWEPILSAALTDVLKEKGYDGVIASSSSDPIAEIVAFDPTQVKSVNNRGTFDPNDPRILYQGGVDYVYHGTSEGAFRRIREEGIKPSRNGKAYYSDSKTYAKSYASRKSGRLLRVRRRQSMEIDAATTKASDKIKDFVTPETVVPDEIEVWAGSRWVNIQEYSDEARNIFAIRPPSSFEQEKRGSIVLPSGGLGEGQTVINLFEAADLSTFVHESGHFFLEAFNALASDENAPQSMKDDMAAILDWFGVKGWSEVGVKQHEQWARGFEAYAMEGKAPSLALADAFARFKAWLTRIYRSIAGLDVKITPQIREVMDRMLATDAEIAEARAEMGMRPLFADAPPGMSEGDFATYQRMARRSTEQAEQALLEKTMAKIRREKQAWFREEKQATRAEVQTEFDRQPRYRLIDMLANQLWHGLNEDGEARTVPDVQIDRKMLIEQFGEGVLPEISRTRLGGKRAIYGDNGSSPQEVAEFFGFGSAVEMIDVLQNTAKKQDAIAAEVERRMMERHGDPLNDGSIEEEALAAIHNEQQANVTISEARHMARQLGRPTRTMAAKFYRLRARDMIGRMTVRDASRADRFLAAERKAARAAQDAFARVAKGKGEGALAEALQAKEQQILNGFLYDEARKVAQEVQKGREKMRAYGKKSVREKLEGGYIEQIDAILQDYDFRVRGPGQVARTESLKAFVDRMIADGREGEIAIDPRLMEEAHRKHYSRLTVDELRGLLDTVANLDHLGRFKQKLVDAAKKRDLGATVEQVVGAMDANLKDRPPNRTETSGEKARRKGRDFLNLTLNADTLLREIDGFEDLGPSWKALKEDLDGGMARLAERRVEMAKELDRIYSVYSTKEKREMSVKKAIPEMGGLFSKWDIIAIALNTGNDENYARLTNPRTKGGFTPEQVKIALGQMDGRDWSMVQSMWDYIDTFWPEIADKERRNTGVSPKKVDAKLMVDAPSGIRGGYYPIRYDPRLSHRVTENDTKDLMDRMRAGSFGKAQTKNGHTKERQQNVTLPLRLDLGVAHEHLANVIYDLEIGEPVNNAHRILRDERVRDAFRQKGKQSDYDALELWLQDTAAGDQVRAGFGQSVLRHMRSGFVISRLALNLSTALIQPSGLAQSMVVVGKKPMLKGTLSYLGRMGGWVDDVLAVSPLMRERQKTFQRDIFNVVGDLESGPVTGRWSKFHRDVIIPLSFFLMQKVQFYAVDMPTWIAAYEKEIAASGNEEKARTYADSMVRRAQGSGLMSDRGMMERGTIGRDIRQSEIPRLFTALGSYMFAKGNVAYERTMRTNFKSPAEAFSWAVDMGLLFTLEAVLYAAVKGFLPDEDEDDTVWLAKETALSAMSTLPFVRDLASVAQGFGGGIYGSILDTAFARPMTQIGQGETDRALIKSLVDAGGIFLHLPSTQMRNILNGLLEDDGSLRSSPDVMGMIGLGGEGRVTIADYLARQ